MKCGAQKKHNRGICQAWPVKGRTRCKLHGGMTLVGPAASDYRHGRYSKYIPVRMAAKYREAEKDHDLLSLRSEVSLVDARLADLLTRVDTGESGALWGDLKKARADFAMYRTMPGHVDQMTAALEKMLAVIESGVVDYAAWAEIGERLEQRRKLVESEHKRLVSLQALISTEKAMNMVIALTDIVTRHVTDKRALSNIVVELQQMVVREQGPIPVYAAIEGEAP